MGLQAELPIYSDSVNAQIWVSRKAHSSGVPACREIMDKLSMADRFLQLGGYAKVKQRLPLRDWKTSKWGEIPADFGRK
ncbi:Ribonuclease H [compost metagenome]